MPTARRCNDGPMNFLIKVAVNGVAVWIASLLFDGIVFEDASSTPAKVITVLAVPAVVGVARPGRDAPAVPAVPLVPAGPARPAGGDRATGSSRPWWSSPSSWVC